MKNEFKVIADLIEKDKIDIKGLPVVDWVFSKESLSLFDLIFQEGEISNLGKNFLSNSGFRLYSILFWSKLF